MMSLQYKRIQLPLLGAILFCLLVGVYLFAWKRSSKKSEPAPAIVKHSVDTPPNDALKYWTADKMRRAKPVDLPNVKALEPGKQKPRRPPHKSDPQQG